MGDEFSDQDLQNIKGREPETDKEKVECEENLEVPTPSLPSEVKSGCSDQATGPSEGCGSTSGISEVPSAEGRKSASTNDAPTGEKSAFGGKGAIAECKSPPKSQEPTPASDSPKECLVGISPGKQKSRMAKAASGSIKLIVKVGTKIKRSLSPTKPDDHAALISDTDAPSTSGKEPSPERVQAIQLPPERPPLYAELTGQAGGRTEGLVFTEVPEVYDETITEMSTLSDSTSLDDATDRKCSIASLDLDQEFETDFEAVFSKTTEDISVLGKESEASSSPMDQLQGQKRFNDPEDCPEVCGSPRKRVVSRKPENPEEKSKDESDVKE